ncbi:MAG: hypothetical protein ABSB19_14945 [Methylomonas sp.]
MSEQTYTDTANHPVVSIVKGVDQDVARGEDIIMLGYSLVLAAPIFAPIAPPHILLPLMALAFLITVCVARRHFHGIQAKFKASQSACRSHEFEQLKPIADVFARHPEFTLAEGFNPLKNLLRTLKSLLGALMINPFWMPIFYLLGLQFAEEKQLQILNRAVMQLEQQTSRWR